MPIKGAKVEAYFDNLLPDNPKICEHIADLLGAGSSKPFDLLGTIGKDCVGAISLGTEPPTGDIAPLSLKEVAEADIEQTLKDTRFNNTLGMKQDEDFRISLAGAQEKTALTLWADKWYKPQGQTATTHIFKPPILHHEQMNIDLSSSVDNEWFCMRFLHYMDMDIAQADIMQFGSQKVLVVERFDRKIVPNNIVRLPQEDMCQALGVFSGAKYEDKGGPGAQAIMDLLATSVNPTEDRYTFMKAQLIFWLLAAIDGHAKNYSIFLTANGFKMTPLYDVISAYPYFGQGNIQAKKIKMAMKVHGKNSHYHWDNIMLRHWSSNAKHLRFDPQFMEKIISQVNAQAMDALDLAFADKNALFDTRVGEAIAEGVTKALKRLQPTPPSRG
jgi:serine/threonine-protein kinase HipA